MSEKNNIHNEEELWDLLSEPVATDPKAAKPKGEPRFLKPESGEAPSRKPEPAPAAAAPKSGKKINGFFLTCMAGVAAVSVAATLLCSSLLGGAPSDSAKDPVQGGSDMTGSSVSAELEQENAALKLENAELRAQLEQQKQQVKDLQNDLLTLMGSEDFISNAATDPTGENEVVDAQMKALDTFAAVQEAYADFDREKLEELIPQMDELLEYLTPEMRNNYYLILEYVEQPSNG